MTLLRVALVLLLLAAPAAAQVVPAGVIQLRDEGTPLGPVNTLNCAGAGITCTVSGVVGTLTVPGGGGAGTVTGSGTATFLPVWTGATAIGDSIVQQTPATNSIAVAPGAANQVVIGGSTTGNPLTVSATGSDTDIPIWLQPKGGAGVWISGGDSTALVVDTQGNNAAIIFNEPVVGPPTGIFSNGGSLIDGVLGLLSYTAGPTNLVGSILRVTSLNGTLDAPDPPADGQVIFQLLQYPNNSGTHGIAAAYKTVVRSTTPSLFGADQVWYGRAIDTNTNANLEFLRFDATTSGVLLTAPGVGIDLGVTDPNGATVGGSLSVITRTGTPDKFAAFDSGGKLVDGAAYVAPGTVTSVATSAPITGGTITTTGTIACPTCNPLTNNPFVPAGANATGGIIGNGCTAGSSVPMFSVTNVASVLHPGVPNSGYARNFSVYLAAAQAAGARSLWRLRESQLQDGLQDLVITDAAAAGTFRKVTVIRAIQGGYLDTRGDNGSGIGGTTPTGCSAEWVQDDGGVMIGAVNPSGVTHGTGLTRFVGAYSSGVALVTTAIAAGTPAPFAGTLKNMCFTVNSGTDGTYVGTMVVAGSATTITRTAALNTTQGLWCDYVNTAAVSANDPIAFQGVNNASGNATLYGWTAEIVPTSGTPGIVGGYIGGAVSSGSTTYYRPFTATSNATESNVRMPMPRAGTYTNFCVQKSVAASAGTTTATIFKNGASTGQLSFTLGNTTGPDCTTGSVAVAQGDTITLEIKNSSACGAGCPTLGGWSINY